MPTLTATVTTTRELVLKPTVRRKLLTELKTYQELKGQLDAIKSAMDKHKGVIGKLREETGEQSIKIDGFSVTLVAPVRSTLDKQKLIAQGVTMAQIEAATIVKPGAAYEKISLPGNGRDEED